MRSRIAVVLAVLVAAAAGSSYRPATGIAAVLALPIDVTSEDCSVVCSDNICDSQEHDAWDEDIILPTNERGSGAHSVSNPCWPGSCALKHAECSPGFASTTALEDVRVALAKGDSRALARILAGPGGSAFRLNRDRLAIQVVNCQEAVVAHLPASDRVLNGVVSALPTE